MIQSALMEEEETDEDDEEVDEDTELKNKLKAAGLIKTPGEDGATSSETKKDK